MRINVNAFNEHYHQNGKFIDNFQAGIKLLPFNSTTTSTFDKSCGIQGSTGEFMRLLVNDGSSPINDIEKDIWDPVHAYLETMEMPNSQIEEFHNMLMDVLSVDGNLNITDSSFLKYLPLVPKDERIINKDRNKYSDGQKKIASYLFSFLPGGFDVGSYSKNDNLFIKILKDALPTFGPESDLSKNKEYLALPFISKTFEVDLEWLFKQGDAVIIKNIHLLLHFYACYAVTQAIMSLNPRCKDEIKTPRPLYFILNTEKASVNHDAVISWARQVPKFYLDKLYGRSQALDIANTILGGNMGFYSNIYEALSGTPFEDNKDLCEKVLEEYQNEKREVFSRRTSEDGSMDEIDVTVNSYEDFLVKLESLCMGLQSPSYISRMRKKVVDLLSVRFLQCRRGNFVLTLDHEMLTFLIALVTKSKKTKLETMYKQFNSYGIYFNRGTRLSIEDYLLKLNLLDRKSDSGEAQYVKVIL